VSAPGAGWQALPGFPAEGYTARVLRTAGDLDAWEPAWRRLFGRARGCAPFLSPDWQLAWWRAYGAGRSPSVVAVHGSGELRALLPLFSEGAGVLKAIGERRLDELGALLDEGHPRAAEALGTALAAQRDWTFLELHAWSAGREVLARLRSGLGAGLPFAVRVYERCPFVETRAGWAALLASKPSRFRKWTRKVERRARGHGETVVRVLEPPALKPDHLTLLAELERSSSHWEAGTAHFQDPRFASLLRECLERGVPLAAIVLEVGGRPVAGELLARHDGTDLGLWTAFDRAFDYTGSYVVQEALRRACEAGCARFDFLQGDERYKLEWATGVREVDQAVVARLRPAPLLRYALTRLRWAVAASPRLRELAERLRALRSRRAAPRALREAEDEGDRD
jgi:CelD/BcsL family acetyltransferase involved in cellulose biosynthesis